jgi:hypothetical protein
MYSLDEMSAHDAIALYYEKHNAIRQGNMIKLLELKKQCPEIFDKTKDAEMFDMIEHMELFQASDRYKELRRLDVKSKLTVLINEAISNNN